MLCLREPGGTEVGEQLRAVVLDPANDGMSDEAELLIYEAARAQLMAQAEKTIELVDRIQGLDQAAEAQRRRQLEQATNPASIVTGIAKGPLGHAGARGWAGAAASP